MAQRLLFIFLFVLPCVLKGQERFYASLDAEKIVLGSYLEVSFVLENLDGNNFQAPAFRDMDIISGPNRSSSMRIINGNVSKKLSYSYSLRPRKIGRYTIPPARVKTARGILETQSLSFEVIEAANDKNTEAREVFILSELSDSTAYIGQQLTLDYKLYTTKDIRSINFAVDPDFEAFYVQTPGNDYTPSKREIINGIEYTSKIIKRYQLYPQQKGVYEIEAVPVTLGVVGDKPSRSFFFSAQLEPLQLITDSKTIEVKTIPESAPPSFSGAVGDYKMRSFVNKRSITTDDALIVYMSLSGDGDSKTVVAPNWIRNDSFDVYDPNIVEDSLFRYSNRSFHRKTFEYLMVPKYPGSYRLYPEFSYFNPDSQLYITLRDTLPEINVIKGSQKAIAAENDRNALNLEIYPDLGRSARNPRLTSIPWPLVLFGTALFISLGLVFYSLWNQKNIQAKKQQRIENQALEEAKRRLKKLNELKESDTKKFFEELARVIKQFLEDKYRVPALHIGKEEIIKQLETRNFDASKIDLIDKLLQSTETAIYAPGLAPEPEQVYKLTLELFTDLL